MTRAQAQVAFVEGKKIGHKLFLSGEFVVLSDGKMLDESGQVLDKQDFWLVRSGNSSFDNDWFIID